MARLYEGLGARVLDGGPTLNPSTYELLAGIHDVPAQEVVVLPNSPNVIMAAERAAELSEKPARVVPTTAAQEGLAALLSFDPREACDPNAAALAEATAVLSLGGVAPAAKDDAQGRFSVGHTVGYAGDDLVAWGDPAETFAETVRRVAVGRRAADRRGRRGRAAGRGGAGGPDARRESSWTSSRATSRRGGGCSARSSALPSTAAPIICTSPPPSPAPTS